MKKVALLLITLISVAAMADTDLVFSGSMPASLKEQVLADLDLVRGMQGGDGTPIFRQIFSGPFDGTAVYGFFRERIKAVNNLEVCDNPLMAACVIHSLSRSTIFLTENYAKFDMPQVYRASILIHESRHTEEESGFWMHDKCPKPFRDWQGKPVVSLVTKASLEGQAACDRTSYGAYGVQAQFLKNAEMYCTNCNEKVKLDARIFGTDSVRRISNPEASAQIRLDLKI